MEKKKKDEEEEGRKLLAYFSFPPLLLAFVACFSFCQFFFLPPSLPSSLSLSLSFCLEIDETFLFSPLLLLLLLQGPSQRKRDSVKREGREREREKRYVSKTTFLLAEVIFAS